MVKHSMIKTNQYFKYEQSTIFLKAWFIEKSLDIAFYFLNALL